MFAQKTVLPEQVVPMGGESPGIALLPEQWAYVLLRPGTLVSPSQRSVFWHRYSLTVNLC